MKSNADPELLEAIRAAGNFDYLSDLHSSRYKARVLTAVERIERDQYCLKEWRDAAAYILGTNAGENASSVSEIIAHIVTFLRD